MPNVRTQADRESVVRISSFLSTLPNNDNEVLIQYDLLFDQREGPSVYRVDLKTSKRNQVMKNPGKVTEWFTDWQGNVRLGMREDRKQITVLHRWPNQSDWEELTKQTLDDWSYYPLGFSPDGRTLYALEEIDGLGSVLITVDLANKSRREVVFDPPQGEVIDTILDFQTHEVVGAKYESDRLRTHYFKPDWARRQMQVDTALPDRVNQWVDGSRDGKRILLKSSSDRVEAEYYLYEPNQKKLTQLFSARPWLKPEELGQMHAISYPSADGLTIPAKFTLPSGTATNQLPLVVLPHGGPWTHDSWTWDPDVQFLISRGYAVLQPNFRGSDGYGKKFLEAGYKEWGGKMQDDISAGVKWAIDHGYADPKRVAIFGGSYGGYAALMGLIRTPELYRCGISYVPVTDLRRWLGSKYWVSRIDRQLLAQSVGERWADSAELKAASPIEHVSKIQAPLLFAWGGADDRIDAADGHRFVAALKRQGKPHKAIFKKDEGHGFLYRENVEEFYTAVEDFLRENLAADQR